MREIRSKGARWAMLATLLVGLGVAALALRDVGPFDDSAAHSHVLQRPEGKVPLFGIQPNANAFTCAYFGMPAVDAAERIADDPHRRGRPIRWRYTRYVRDPSKVERLRRSIEAQNEAVQAQDGQTVIELPPPVPEGYTRAVKAPPRGTTIEDFAFDAGKIFVFVYDSDDDRVKNIPPQDC